MTDTIQANGAAPPVEESLDGFRWEDPPTRARGGNHRLPYAAWARLMRRKPGVWAHLQEFAGRSSAATVVTRHHKERIPLLPVEEFELKSAKRESGGSALYGRCLDEPATEVIRG